MLVIFCEHLPNHETYFHIFCNQYAKSVQTFCFIKNIFHMTNVSNVLLAIKGKAIIVITALETAFYHITIALLFPPGKTVLTKHLLSKSLLFFFISHLRIVYCPIKTKRHIVWFIAVRIRLRSAPTLANVYFITIFAFFTCIRKLEITIKIEN